MTRGMAEIVRIGIKLGGKIETLLWAYRNGRFNSNLYKYAF